MYVLVFLSSSVGPLLGPLFFIIFINDISNIFNNDDNINLNLYADDTSLNIFVISNNELSSNSQLYLDRLSHWFNINKLKLILKKLKYYLILKQQL